MSPHVPTQAARSFRALAITLVVAACGDHSRILAPAAPLELAADTPARVVQCDVSWINAAGGSWNVATNWSTGAVPTATQDVCITLNGTYIVTLNGVVTTNTLTVGATNSTGAQLNVEAFFASSSLTATNGIVNHGIIALTANIVSNDMHSALAVTNGILENNGTFYSWPDGVGSQRIIRANMVNNGTVHVLTPLQLIKPGGVFENRGAFNVNAQVYLAGALGQTFRQSAGTLNIAAGAALNVDKETFEFVGGTIAGAPSIINGTLRIAEGNGDVGNFAMLGQTTFAGNIAAAQGVYVVAQGVAATMTSATGFTNAGKLELTYSFGINNQMPSSLAITNGALMNTGSLRLPPHFAFTQIAADVINLGTMDVQSLLTLTKPGAVFENRGTITVFPGAQLNVTANTNQLFRQAGGTLTLTGSGTMNVPGNTFEAAGGTVIGVPQLNNALLRFAAECSGSGTIATLGSNAKLEGDVPTGWTVHVNGPAFSQLTSAGSFTNRGTIELSRSFGGDNSGNTMLTVTNGALTNEGSLVMVPDGLGAMRTINANVINNGTVSVQTTVTLARPNGTFVNNGTIAMASTSIMVVNGAAQTFTTTGPITGGGRIDFTGTTVNASGTVVVHMILINSAMHIGGAALGTLNMNGAYTMSGGSFNVQLRDDGPGGYDRLNLSGIHGGAALGTTGTLNVSPFESACIEPSQTFDIMTYVAHSGDFAVKNGLDLGGDRTLTSTPGGTVYKLASAGPACAPADATPPIITPTVGGGLGDNGWYVTDVIVTWSVTDADSPVTSKTGCDATALVTDHVGMTYTCTATSAGGTATKSVTVKRDMTPPVVTATRAPAANAHGWNREQVTATFTATDATSGIAGAVTATHVFSQQGANQGASRHFVDNAGNAGIALLSGVSIDWTDPVITVTRSPLAGPDGWNDTDVTATWSASDALSGIDGSSTATHLFDQEGASQSAWRSFSDKAGNSASATIANINIDKTPVPPPPPPTLSPVCSATPNEIWAPNNKLVAVRVTVGGAGVVSFSLRSVSNNETGGADISGWTIGAADVDGSVLAKRNGGGTGRTYTLTYDVFGVNGATGSCAVTVRVPHDQRR